MDCLHYSWLMYTDMESTERLGERGALCGYTDLSNCLHN
uniref:Uncharacterized protein n=1 Tax=Anguilla anguilla TaxID=7936 RepID=A0A0E9RMF4_ANGAN